MALVKICGIKSAEDAMVAMQAGAHWIGMVFFEKSPRHLTFEQAGTIRNSMKKSPKLVALVVDADDQNLEAITAGIRPDFIQCHGNETPERVAKIKARFNTPIIKAIGVSSPREVQGAEDYDGIADMILFDSAPAPSSLPGGRGQAFDWGLMKNYQGKTPWMLAGGLTPDNVAEAIRISGAEAVDVSSGVEDAVGHKNHQAIRDFVSAAR